MILPRSLTVFGLAAAALSLLSGGCPPGDDPADGAPDVVEYDGRWRVQIAGLNSIACITVSGGRITDMDGSCDNLSDGYGIISNPPASVSNGIILWTLTQTNFTSARSYTYSLVEQSNGSLVGTLTFVEGTTPASYQVTFVRR